MTPTERAVKIVSVIRAFVAVGVVALLVAILA